MTQLSLPVSQNGMWCIFLPGSIALLGLPSRSKRAVTFADGEAPGQAEEAGQATEAGANVSLTALDEKIAALEAELDAEDESSSDDDADSDEDSGSGRDTAAEASEGVASRSLASSLAFFSTLPSSPP